MRLYLLSQAARNADCDGSSQDYDAFFRCNLPTDHLAGVFRNFSAFKKGRDVLLAGEGALFLKICACTRQGSELRRIAVAACVRNVALEPTTFSHPILPSLITTLALPFAPGCELRDGDDTDMPMQLLRVAAEPAERREISAAVRLACIESLRYIASTATGRKKIVSCKVYPCLRDAHMAEEDETIKELMEEVVELTQLSDM
jgi:hypothetical protein